MDRRQKKTRQAVYDAFTRLLEKKTYSNITVQEIIDAADIGRSTFYSHFETKDDLLRTLCAEIFGHVFSEHLTQEDSHDFSHDQSDMKSKITHILYHLQDNRNYIRSILSCESGEVFMLSFRTHLEQVFEGELAHCASVIPTEYLRDHMVWDFAETVRWWMKRPQYTPEEISGFFFGTAPAVEGMPTHAPNALENASPIS